MCARGRATVMRTWREWVLIAAERCHNNCSARRAQPCPVERISLLAPSAKKWKTEFHYGGGAAECGRQELDQTSDRMNGERRRRCFDGWLSAIELSMWRPAVTGWPSTRPWMKDICPRTSAPVHLIPSLSKTTIVDICALGPNSNPIRDPDSKS